MTFRPVRQVQSRVLSQCKFFCINGASNKENSKMHQKMSNNVALEIDLTVAKRSSNMIIGFKTLRDKSIKLDKTEVKCPSLLSKLFSY